MRIMDKKKWFLNGGRGSGKTFRLLCEIYENKITELEKACEETQELLDKQIEATYKLDKENAELKKDKKELCHSISEGGKDCVYLNEQLAKAKELLERLLITSCNSDVLNLLPNCSEVLRVRVEAEQFLKDSEVKNDN